MATPFPSLPSGDNPYATAAIGAEQAAGDGAGGFMPKKKKKKPSTPGAAPSGPFDLSANPPGAPATPSSGLMDSLNAANGEDI
jgi:hypothetical protein